MLATKGVKKAAAEKALDALAEKGKVVRALGTMWCTHMCRRGGSVRA